MKGTTVFMLIFGFIQLTMQEQPIMLVKDRGHISFYEKTHLIKYDIDTTNYFKNAEKIMNSSIELEIACNNLIDKKTCGVFLQNLEEDLKTVNISANYMRTALSTRGKRWVGKLLRKIFSWKTIAKEASSVVMTAVVADAVYDARDKEKEEKNDEKIDKHIKLTEKNMQAQTDFMNKTEERFAEDKKEEKFNDLMRTAMDAISKYWRDTVTLTGILNNEPKNIFFNMVDIVNFSKQLDTINEKLKPEFTLPLISVLDILEISEIETIKKSTHVELIIHIPIISHKSFELKEFIPISL